MNRLLTRLPSILCALLATTPIYAKQQPQWLSESEFVAAINTTQGSPSHYLAVSEKFGIALLNENNQALSSLPFKSEQLSFKKHSSKNDTGVLATLDINSGEIFFQSTRSETFHTLIIHTEWLVFMEITEGPFLKEDTVFPEWTLEKPTDEEKKNFFLKIFEESKSI